MCWSSQYEVHRALLGLGREVDTHPIDAVPLILGIAKPLPLEDVSQMPATVVANNLRPHHAQTRIGPLSNSVREGVPEGGPPAPRVELVVGLVKRRFASRARVDTSVRVVLV